MKTNKTKIRKSPQWKTITCILLSIFYFAMLAYPFGVSTEGYLMTQVLIAGVIFFAISIPAWIINIKREFYSDEAEELESSSVTLDDESSPDKISRRGTRIGELAMTKNWLTPDDIKQILFCQKSEKGKLFGEVAVKRNYLQQYQVDSLLAWQPGA